MPNPAPSPMCGPMCSPVTYLLANPMSNCRYAHAATQVLSHGGDVQSKAGRQEVAKVVRNTSFVGLGNTTVHLDSRGDRIEYANPMYVLMDHSYKCPDGPVDARAACAAYNPRPVDTTWFSNSDRVRVFMRHTRLGHRPEGEKHYYLLARMYT